MLLYAWNLNEQQAVLLRPWMRFCPWICTSRVTDDQWEQVLQYSVTTQQYALICANRQRHQ